MKTLFVTLASFKYGIGHFNRCLSLADKLKNSNINFIIFIDQKSKNKILQKKLKYNILFLKFPSDNLQKKLKKIGSIDQTIFDISNNYFASSILDKNLFFNAFREISKKTILLDGGYNESLLRKNKELHFDLVISPYVDKYVKVKKDIKKINGHKFFILNTNNFLKLGRKRFILKKAENILISCGGSDPANQSLLTLRALNFINKKLKVKLIIGPYFAKKYINELVSLKLNKNINCKFIKNKSNIFPYAYWADLAIISSGLTKYEFLAVGTPCVSISINKPHKLITEIFEKKKTLVSAGISPKEKKLSKIIEDLLLNYKLRKLISKNGKNLIDGKGLQRVVNHLNVV